MYMILLEWWLLMKDILCFLIKIGENFLEKFMKFEYPTRELIYDFIDKIEINKDRNIEVFFCVDIKVLQEEIEVV